MLAMVLTLQMLNSFTTLVATCGGGGGDLRRQRLRLHSKVKLLQF